MNKAFGGVTFRACKPLRHGCGVKRLFVAVALCLTFLTRNNLVEKLGILSGLGLAISFRSSSVNIPGVDHQLKVGL